jgi:hypothetical protein
MTTETTTFSNQVVALKRDLLADISETTHLKSTHREHRPISVDVDFNL